MLEIRGADDIDALLKRMREHANRKEIERRFRRSLARIARDDIKGPMIEAIPAALPKSGGLAAQVQGATRVRISAKSGRDAGASMWFTSRQHDIRTLAGQRLRHPVFGNRSTWVEQDEGVKPAAFIGEFERQTPAVKAALIEAFQELAREVAE